MRFQDIPGFDPRALARDWTIFRDSSVKSFLTLLLLRWIEERKTELCNCAPEKLTKLQGQIEELTRLVNQFDSREDMGLTASDLLKFFGKKL